MSGQGTPEAKQLERAQREVEQAKQRLASTMGALQYRLRPATLMNQAWEGVREKSGEFADDALQVVKDRPVTASGIVAGSVIYLARHPLARLFSGLFSRGRDEDDPSVVTASLDGNDESYDLTAPTVDKARFEGVNA